MKRVLITVIPLLVFALVVVLRAWDPLPVQQLRFLVFDTYQRLKPRAYDPNAPVRIVDIDDASLARFGQWPWPRSLLADLVSRLAQAGAAAIAFDVVFAEPDRSSPEEAMRYWPRSPEVDSLRVALSRVPSNDSVLAEAVANTSAITGFVLTQETAGSKSLPARANPELAALGPALPIASAPDGPL